MKKETYLEQRDKLVVKANELIQKSRFNLSLQQQKIVLYLISQIMPQDDDFKLYSFTIPEFCRVCGITVESGKNYQDVKNAIKEIADKSLWIRLPNGKSTLVRWIEKPYIDDKSGVIDIRLDADMKPYLLQLKENFTEYEIIYTLHFKSKYSIRLYELCKSIHYNDLEEYHRRYSIEELRQLLGAESYTVFKDFRRRVLEPAIDEINEYSDKEVNYQTITQGRKVIGIELFVKSKETAEVLKIRATIEKEMGTDQITLWDYLKK